MTQPLPYAEAVALPRPERVAALIAGHRHLEGRA